MQEAGSFTLQTSGGGVRARRLLLAAGGWTQPLAESLGFHQPIQVRVNTVAVTEQAPDWCGR